MARRLLKSERLVAEQMLAIIEWAADHPSHWDDIGPLPASKQAAELPAKRGVIKIWPETVAAMLAPVSMKQKNCDVKGTDPSGQR